MPFSSPGKASVCRQTQRSFLLNAQVHHWNEISSSCCSEAWSALSERGFKMPINCRFQACSTSMDVSDWRFEYGKAHSSTRRGEMSSNSFSSALLAPGPRCYVSSQLRFELACTTNTQIACISCVFVDMLAIPDLCAATQSGPQSGAGWLCLA